MENNRLFDQFPPVTTREWLEKINADLKGADFNRKLVWKTGEGFDVKPFYRNEDLESIEYSMDLIPLLKRDDTSGSGADTITGKMNNNWLVRQNIRVSDYQDANRKALLLKEKGTDSLGFIIEDPGSVNENNFKTLLNGIDPGETEINFRSEGAAKEILSSLIRSYPMNGYDPSLIRGCLETDPLGRLMLNGTLCIPPAQGFDYLASLTGDSLSLPGFRNIQVNGSNFTNAGAGAVQELAFSLSMAVEYISQLTERGLNAEDVARKIRFSFGLGSNFFMEVAKLRAARILWSVIAEKYKPLIRSSFRMEMHCITSEWNSTLLDPYINMLRTQTEAMSAVIGGTDSLTVNPYDLASNEPGDFSERIARNQQLILREEAFFDKVLDPGSGSYYIENLTAMVADNAWKLFLGMEEKGGFLDSLKAGFIREKAEAASEQRKRDICSRKEVLVGVNKYPDPDWKFAGKGENSSYKTDLSGKDNDLLVEPVKLKRGAEQIEKIRLAVENAGHRPNVFLFTIGNNVFRKARAQFTAGFFGCAGYRIIDNDGFAAVEDGVKAALKSEADIVVICSSDEEYPVVAPDILRKIGGKAIVVIAGNPECIDILKSAGINNFISLKSDICETLAYYNSLLGIKN